jgi:hydrogenase/urease accessory protein HupE
MMPHVQLGIRRAALLVGLGLLVQLGATMYWTPLTFVIFSMVGIPLVLLGVLVYVVTVWRFLKRTKAL